MKFNIPKRRYQSSEATHVVALKMPKAMIDALDRHARALKYTRSALADLILDQFYAAMEGRSTLPELSEKYQGSDRISTSLRIDADLYANLEKWGEKEKWKPKISALIFLALDVYLSQNKIQK
jgi:hypothetical protein